MKNPYDIKVDVDISADSLDARLICESLAVVEKLLFDSELRDLQALTLEFREDIPKIAAEAAKYRIKKLKGHALKLATISPGSIVLSGLVGGLAVWVLSATLGETLKQAWLESDLHQRVKAFLLKKRRTKILDLEHEIENKLPRRLDRLNYSSSVQVSTVGSGYELSKLYIRVSSNFMGLITPTLQQVLDEKHKELIIASENLSRIDFDKR